MPRSARGARHGGSEAHVVERGAGGEVEPLEGRERAKQAWQRLPVDLVHPSIPNPVALCVEPTSKVHGCTTSLSSKRCWNHGAGVEQ
jgi:hypothetical protein